MPELDRMIGPQPDVPALAPLDTQIRFQAVFQHFVGVFARPEHPLVIFIDDPVARSGDARPHEAARHPSGHRAPHAHRGLPGQRGRCRPHASAHGGRFGNRERHAQEALKRSACFGNNAGIATLELVLDATEAEINESLRVAVQSGIIVSRGGHYRFLHDHVQEAAYARGVNDSDRPR